MKLPLPPRAVLLALAPILVSLCAAAQVAEQDQPVRDPFAFDAVTVDRMEARARTRAYVQGEVVVALEVVGEAARLGDQLRRIPWSDRVGVAQATFGRTLLSFERFSNVSVALVLIDLGGGDVFEAMRALEGSADVLWSSPNFTSTLEDPREIVPNDPLYGSQYHHPLMQNDLAWDLTLAVPRS